MIKKFLKAMLFVVKETMVGEIALITILYVPMILLSIMINGGNFNLEAVFCSLGLLLLELYAIAGIIHYCEATKYAKENECDICTAWEATTSYYD